MDLAETQPEVDTSSRATFGDTGERGGKLPLPARFYDVCVCAYFG